LLQTNSLDATIPVQNASIEKSASSGDDVIRQTLSPEEMIKRLATENLSLRKRNLELEKKIASKDWQLKCIEDDNNLYLRHKFRAERQLEDLKRQMGIGSLVTQPVVCQQHKIRKVVVIE
jgi:hypothetical protein